MRTGFTSSLICMVLFNTFLTAYISNFSEKIELLRSFLFLFCIFGGEHFTLFSITSFPDIEKMQRHANEDLFIF